jgi:hypothetical protein
MRAILNRLSNRERTLLYVTVGAVGLALWYSYLMGPMIGRWRNLRARVDRSELQYEKFARVARREDTTRMEYQAIADRLKMKGSDQEEMAVLLKEIESLARNRIRITNVTPHSVKEFGFYKRFNVEIDCEARMEELVRFIYEAEESESLLRLHRLRVQVKSGDPGLVEVSLLLSKLSII